MNSGLDEILYLNEDEFKEILQKWKSCNEQMSKLLSDPDYQNELMAYKSNIVRGHN